MIADASPTKSMINHFNQSITLIHF